MGHLLEIRPGRDEDEQDRSPPPSCVGALSILPVFFDLAGRRVVVAGGSSAAAWKGELLCAAGAEVHLFAPAGELSPDMIELLAAQPAAGRLHHHPRPWRADDLAGAALAVADCSAQAEAKAFAHVARAAGAPVNVIDKPAFCTFRFGSIVNRSPVVVGVSTDGAAPILAQAIRRRIETLLPPSLSGWASLASRLRAEVMERLELPSLRRAFWERLAEAAFTLRPPSGETEGAARRLMERLAASGQTSGRVTLVGAGPGEAELLTLKAVRALQAADVILFDDLVSPDVLELARREARRMPVGKRAGRESCPQAEINARMIALARAGRHVVRLKAGDVSVFARAGEELEALRRAGVAAEIVPGITAASALAASFGVSLTHREHASQLRFVTGHSRKGGLPEEVDWRALAEAQATTIFYMGGRRAAEIAARLTAAGLAGSTPVAVAANLSRPDEAKASGELKDLPALVAKIGLDKPITIGVGQVFGEVVEREASWRLPEAAERLASV